MVGFLAADFSSGDQSAYFFKEEEAARNLFEAHYQAGILEVDIEETAYDQRLRQHERPYLTHPHYTEVVVPQRDFDVLNQAPRRLKP